MKIRKFKKYDKIIKANEAIIDACDYVVNVLHEWSPLEHYLIWSAKRRIKFYKDKLVLNK